MPVAYCLIRPEPHYRADAFRSGLAARGFEVRTGQPSKFEPGDCLVIWSRYGAMHDLALRAEAARVPVAVAENGYLGVNGVSPHSMRVREPYALARGWHNDSTVVQVGPDDRFSALGVILAPWRAPTVDGHILVCPNRPFGSPGRAMPAEWVADVCLRLRKMTSRPIRVRPHPGNAAPHKPLAEDLAGAWTCVIWSSSAGVHALVAGVPVICEAPFWICKPASAPDWLTMNGAAFEPDREAALQRMTHGQFHLNEIASGEAFRRVLA